MAKIPAFPKRKTPRPSRILRNEVKGWVSWLGLRPPRVKYSQTVNRGESKTQFVREIPAIQRVQVPDDFSFSGRNGSISIFLLAAGVAVAAAGLGVIFAGLGFRRKLQRLQASAVLPSVAVLPGGAITSVVARF